MKRGGEHNTHKETYRCRGYTLTMGVWILQEGMENQATGGRGQDFHGNGKRDTLLGIDSKGIQNNATAFFAEGG